jgi:hypothetical protein
MLLSPGKKFLFVHIAKTAGTSVRAALSRIRMRDPYYWLMFPAYKLSQATNHKIGTKFPRHAHAIAAKEMLPKEFYDSLFKFAFVRNPWDLQVSSFHHIQRERPQFLGGHNNFTDFLKWKLDPHRQYQYHIDTSIDLQSNYVTGLDGELIVDFIGRYETLESDFERILTRIGEPNIRLPHKRKASSRKKDYREYYSDTTAELVYNHFKRDIDLFGYKFDCAQ